MSPPSTVEERPRVGIIVAVSPEGVIGQDGKIPWHYPADLKRFKRLTIGSTVIMGRLTWASMPRKPLPERRNIVISSSPVEGVETFPSIPSALAATNGPVWFIGGARIYEEAMKVADLIDVTYVPDHIVASNTVLFPEIDPSQWTASDLLVHEDDERLRRRVYHRRPIQSVFR